MKKIVVAYINIGDKSYPKEANEYLTFAKERIQEEFGDKYNVKVIPITKGEDRIEFKYTDLDEKTSEVYQTLNENFSNMADYMEKSFSTFVKKIENTFDAYKKG